MTKELHATYQQEAEVLERLLAINPGPWACDECDTRISAATEWKPQFAFIFNEFGVHRAVIRILCGACGAVQ